jgi:hypothetical protein
MHGIRDYRELLRKRKRKNEMRGKKGKMIDSSITMMTRRRGEGGEGCKETHDDQDDTMTRRGEIGCTILGLVC